MYDYIIVGAGSAGCVLAMRLSQNPDCNVLLIEAGESDWNPLIHMPAGISQLVNNKKINWNYYTEPEPELQFRRLWWPRGKVLGGSSAINAMCYIRGVADDYNYWEQHYGASGWGWNNVLPYFIKSENNQRGASLYHGHSGLLHVSDLKYTNPLSKIFIDAAQQAGIPFNSDFNGENQHGVGFYQVTQYDGKRCSSATAYLNPAKKRSNLKIITSALVSKIIIDKKRATGIEFFIKGKLNKAYSQHDIILSAGAINSPQLLMLSGIGDPEELKSHSIQIQQAIPEVGKNLQDHLDICTLFHTKPGVTYDNANPLKIAFDYFLRQRQGAGTSNIAEAGGFIRSHLAPDKRADIQLHFVPAMLDNHGRNRLKGDGYTLHACYLHPHSRGKISLYNSDPATPAKIQAHYLSDKQGFDLKMMQVCAELSQTILSQSAFTGWRGDPIFPKQLKPTQAELIQFIRNKAETIYHPAGTCRMGSDTNAVVTPYLNVQGIDNLRIVDASVMPTLISGNTNAPVIMMAERAADLILQGK